MQKKRTIGIVIFTLAIILSILACGGGAAPTATNPPPPTNTAPPPPTNTPVPPTNTPLPPTNTPLPPTNTPLPPTNTPESGGTTPAQINISDLSGYKDEYNDWHIVGLVTNDTERAVNSLQIEVEIFDKNDNSLYKEIAYSSLYSLAPGEVTPFELWVYEDLPNADHFKATLVGQGVAELTRATLDYQAITMVVDDNNQIALTGELVNNTKDPVDVNGLAAAIFDSTGSLVTASYVGSLRHHLEPGESGPFSFTIYAPTDVVNSLKDYKLYQDAVVVDPATTYDLVLSDKHYDYVDTWGNFHLVGEVTNNSDKYLNVSLVAGVYDETGNVLDASSKSLPVSSIAPGETIPYDFSYWGPIDTVKGTYDKAKTYQVMVDWYWTWESSTIMVDLTTQKDQNSYDSDQGKFTGEVVNNTGKELSSATVIVSLYDKTSGQVIATYYDWLSDKIADGATAAYEVNIDLPSGFDANNVEYIILAKGE